MIYVMMDVKDICDGKTWSMDVMDICDGWM